MSFPRLTSINIKGFRAFRDFTAELGALEVLVGANGSGKSSLFEFLKFLRDATDREIPPEIIEGAYGRQVFYKPGPDEISWKINNISSGTILINYEGIVFGPIGNIGIENEGVGINLDGDDGQYFGRRPHSFSETFKKKRLLDTSNFRAIRPVRDQDYIEKFDQFIYNVSKWRFYNTVTLASEKIRRPVVIEQDPVLKEDCSNLSSVLHQLMTEYPETFNELQSYVRMVIPGFESLTVKARGGPGEVIAFWREKGVDADLTLTDLSDGILRLLCWMVLCLHPKPPALICIDEPDQGVHPRTLSLLAGLLQKASERTQILVATHSSYFLTQFDLANIAVMKKVNGEAVFTKPINSTVIKSLLADFGTDELGYLHWSDQLETFS